MTVRGRDEVGEITAMLQEQKQPGQRDARAIAAIVLPALRRLAKGFRRQNKDLEFETTDYLVTLVLRLVKGEWMPENSNQLHSLAWCVWRGQKSDWLKKRDALKRKGEKVPLDVDLAQDEAKTAVERSLVHEELGREINGALKQLPDQLREPVILHYFDGLSYADTAQAVGVNENLIKRRLHLARTKLASILGEDRT